MEPNTTQEKLEQLNEEEVDADEEEALSFCDLPINMIGDDDKSSKLLDSPITEAQEEFDFSTWGGLSSKESEMCAADEIFFEGQILPLRRSLSTTCFQRHGQQFNWCESEPLNHVSLSAFQSNSSRSSSLKSDQNSSGSSCSTTTISTRRIPEPRAQDQFHTHPIPTPKISVTVPRQTSFGNHGRKVLALGFFHLSVVPASEIGMKIQKLMARSTDSASANKKRANRNSRSSSSNTNKSVKMSCSPDHSSERKHFFKHFGGKSSGLWRGCKYSVETAQSDMVIIKGETKSTNNIESTKARAMEEKVLELKRQSHKQKQEKKNMSHRRTSEWIKELSEESYPD